MLYNNLKPVNYGDSFHIFNIKETEFSFSELFNHFYKKFIETWRVTAEEVETIIANEPRLKESDFFDYCTFDTSFPVKENAFYSEKFIKGAFERTYYNVYVTTASYEDVYLNIVCKHIMRQRFPKLFETPFAIEGRKYHESVKKIKMDTLLSDIDMMEVFSCHGDKLIVADLIDIVVNGNADKTEMKPNWVAYSHGDIFFNTGEAEGHCVYVKIEDLYNHDWQAVLDRKMYSIKKDNGSWYEGRQENAPYMNNPIVKEIEKFVKEC